MAADFISRRALAPVFDGNQKSAARLIAETEHFCNPKRERGIALKLHAVRNEAASVLRLSPLPPQSIFQLDNSSTGGEG